MKLDVQAGHWTLLIRSMYVCRCVAIQSLNEAQLGDSEDLKQLTMQCGATGFSDI